MTSSAGRRPPLTPWLAAYRLRQSHSQQGFFLQIEGASTDKQDHAGDPCGQIGETAAFDRAVKVARAYAATHPDTLVVTTADHGHTSQIVPLEANPPGLSSTLITNESQQLKANYLTNIARRR